MKINYPAVLVAGILHWILGAVWYGIFTNKFVELMAWTPQQLSEIESQSHTKELVLAFVSSLVLVYLLAHFVQHTKATNLVGGLQTAFWLWLGFCGHDATSYRDFRGTQARSLSSEHWLSACRLFDCGRTFGYLETTRST